MTVLLALSACFLSRNGARYLLFQPYSVYSVVDDWHCVIFLCGQILCEMML